MVLLCKLSDLKEKEKIKVEIQERNILAIYYENNVYALDDKCPHMGASLYNGKLENGLIICNRHHAKIDIRNGEIIGSPHIAFLKMKARDATVFETHVEEDNVYIVLHNE